MSELASSLSWAVMTAARRQGVVIDSVRLDAAIATAMGKNGSAAIDLQVLCTALSLPKAQQSDIPERAQLPMLGVVNERGWGIIVDQRPDGRWIFISEEGHALISDSDLIDGAYRLDFAALGAKDGQNGFERVFKEALAEFRPIILEVVIASVVMSIIALGASIFSMQVYDRVIPTHGVATLIVLAIGVSLAILFELGMKFARSHIMDSVVSGLDAKLSQALFERLLSVRVDQLPGSVGSLAGQLRGYEQIRSFYTSQTLFTLVDLPLGLLFVLVIAFIASPWMAMVPTLFGLAAIAIGYLSNRKVVRLADKSAAASNLKTGLLVETVEGVETIKSGSGGWKFLSRWIDVSAESIRSDMAMRAIGDHAGYIAAMLQQLSYSTTVIVGSFLVINGQITMGALIACSILGGRILAPVAMIPGLMVQRAHTKATLAGLEKIYALQTDQGSDRQLTPDTLRGEFRVEEAKFTYAGSLLNAMTIDQLTIKAGERVAILGPIGAGKSTILRLLSGLYRPQQGRILLDGLDLSNINRLTLNQHIGYLQQDHRLFVGTLRENLLIGLPDPGDEVLRQVMERTGLLRLVSAHPKGLDLPIQEGGRGLSGGQRQLVAFTRLLLCRPDIFLLDEPTASMDEDLERHCLNVLNEEINGGRTLVVVTHKPAFLPMVERVIVVVGNRIVLDGPRDAVLARLRGEVPSTNTGVPGVTA
ncbi:ATP-binding cassette domain-containing protein [Herbaspirillum rubrisubalbicans]|jgi:ATP-binding cassette subfamily C protein LapB|uniref:Multidrug ABC transporter ATPase n=3 Tax=Herbaspirillum TaxID=963 RepID=A0ABX9C377_9BURK|nr:ATP-binding cassette domain-containing protein [Herbaspirillum rubrisubalbicans]MCP1573410.1 ATP-binding cassette subfamily C protein LapB [Herbaspirillum rubrisubalbicans]QJQ01908.1 type I secretion system permease/ATPase [Herbaspirillum rubrisubalbicans Os34]RAM64808.1 multidrug ABC transporter ATPase [Herbaspirillum rubrisubalbicans]